MGGCCLFVWVGELSNSKNTKIKYVMALDGRVTIFHTQQPTKDTWAQRSGYMRAVATRGECAWGTKPLFWGALEVERR
jgi:hypothetical protein